MSSHSNSDTNTDNYNTEDEKKQTGIGIKRKKKHASNSRGKVFQESWLEDPIMKQFIEKVDDPTKAKCKVCNKILNAGKSELKKHSEGISHIKKLKAFSFQPPVKFNKNKIVEDDLENKVMVAELKLSVFFAEHNVATQVVDHLIPLIKNIIDDSNIVKKINLGRTKCIEVIKNVICKSETDLLVQDLRVTKFSIMVDESTDISDYKNLCVLVRYEKDGKILTKLLELLKLNASEGSAEKLYNEFKNCMIKHNIPLSNIIGVASDGCNTMIGIHNSFFSHLKNDVPDVILISCICHSSAIVASKACEELPRSPEELLRSVYNYVSGSAKRCSILSEIQEYFNIEQKKMLKLSTTRWLSRQACVVRILENYSVLQHYFQLAVVEDKLLSAENIFNQLNNLCNKAYLYFLKYALNIFNSFNALFQSRLPQIHVLFQKSHLLMRQLCQNFMKKEVIMEQNLGSIKIQNPHNFVDIKKVYLGKECEEILTQIPAEAVHDIRLKCLNFYITSTIQIQKRLPLNNEIFKHMSFLSLNFDEEINVRKVAEQFKNYDVDVDACEVEWRNLSVFDKSLLTKFEDMPVESRWHEISFIKTFDNSYEFKNIAKLAKLILTLPHSNAESERIFSVVTDVKNKKRNRIGSDTLNSICLIRSILQSCNICCYEYSFNPSHKKLWNTKDMYSFK